MKYTFYGVRGSIPVPGAETVRYGGNTTCGFLRTKSGAKYVLDAGTGIRLLGMEMMGDDAKEQETIHILLSHIHWDHIQGFPFFMPAFRKDSHIRVIVDDSKHRSAAILEQMEPRLFPLRSTDLRAHIEVVDFPYIYQMMHEQGVLIKRQRLNHPGGGWGWRFEEDGLSLAFLTDNELFPPQKRPNTPYAATVAFVNKADLLLHDAQYVDSEMPMKLGWGHSTIEQVIQLAIDARVKTVGFMHHDPERTDAELDELADFAKDRLAKENIDSFFAKEKMELEVCEDKVNFLTLP